MAPAIARVLRSQWRGAPAQVSWDDQRRPGKRNTRGSRMVDWVQWGQAAWAEILGLHPLVHWRTATGAHREAAPWRNGAESAWQWLMAETQHPTAAGMARQYLRQLERAGYQPPVKP